MPQLSDLRAHVSSTYAVNADGSLGELVEQTDPRYSADGVAYGSLADALAAVDTSTEVASVPTATEVAPVEPAHEATPHITADAVPAEASDESNGGAVAEVQPSPAE